MPELRDELALIWLCVSPGGDAARMYALIRCAVGESDWASVSPSQIGHISSPSSSASVGCCSLAAAGAASASASSGDDERSLTTQRRATPASDVVAR